MEILNPLKATTLGETKPGDLVIFTIGSDRCIAIVLETANAGGVRVGLLRRDNSRKESMVAHLVGTLNCLSYGSDWAIDFDWGPETRFGYDEVLYKPGTLVVSPQGVSLNFGDTDDSLVLPFNYQLPAMNASEISGAPVLNWRIFAPASRAKAEPLFTHGA